MLLLRQSWWVYCTMVIFGMTSHWLMAVTRCPENGLCLVTLRNPSFPKSTSEVDRAARRAKPSGETLSPETPPMTVRGQMRLRGHRCGAIIGLFLGRFPSKIPTGAEVSR